MKKIKYVQLEPQAALCDIDFQMMTAEERGVYWTIILYLYCNGGRCALDVPAMKALCACENFEKCWEKIKNKFFSKNNFLMHKRVTKQLRCAGRRLQDARQKGLKGAEKRWQSHSYPIANVKRNVIVNEEEDKSRIRIRDTSTKLLSSSFPNSVRPDFSISTPPQLSAKAEAGADRPEPSMTSRLMAFDGALRMVIRPRNQSDRTAFRNIGKWLAQKIQDDQFDIKIFRKVLEFADEAAKGKSRNPAAVFTSILKRELGYSKLKD